MKLVVANIFNAGWDDRADVPSVVPQQVPMMQNIQNLNAHISTSRTTFAEKVVISPAS
jgi:hypothetical protein